MKNHFPHLGYDQSSGVGEVGCSGCSVLRGLEEERDKNEALSWDREHVIGDLKRMEVELEVSESEFHRMRREVEGAEKARQSWKRSWVRFSEHGMKLRDTQLP